MTIPAYLPLYVLGGSVAIIAAILIGLNRSLERARWSSSDRAAAVRLVAAALIGWFALAVGLAWLGAYEGASDRFPTIQFGILVPILVGSILIWRSHYVRRLIEAQPAQTIMAGLQAIMTRVDSAAVLPSIAVPTTVIVGDEDRDRLCCDAGQCRWHAGAGESRREVSGWNVRGRAPDTADLAA